MRSAFVAGAIAVVVMVVLGNIFDPTKRGDLEECRRSNNVYECKLVAVPVIPANSEQAAP